MDKYKAREQGKADVKLRCLLCLFVMIVHSLVVIVSGEVILEPKNGKVVRGENLTLTCSASEGQWYNASTWLVNGQTGIIAYYYASNQCNASGIFENKSQFDYSCGSENQYRTVVMNVDTERHGEIWECYLYHLNQTESERPNITINVDVPVTNVSINESTLSTIEALEDTNITLQCVTSPSRPAANVTWYFVDKDGSNSNIEFGKNTNVLTENHLTSTRTLIWFNAKSDMNGWGVRCNASNVHNYPEPTDSAKLNVLFPTNVPTIQCSENGTYRVIKNHLSNLTCSVDGGNPAGRLEWSCDKNHIHSQLPQLQSSRTVVLNATQSTTYTCISSNGIGKTNTSVTIDVMYPPELKENNNTSLIEGKSLFLKCDVVRSHPSVSTIGWTYNRHTVSNATLILRNASRTDDMVYTCTANNTMEPSCGDVVIGSASKSFHLDVLYPPSVTIKPPGQFTRNESGLLNYTCPITEGNPSSTMFQWWRSNDNTVWNSSKLFLPNLSRDDDAVYTCYASNVMTDSNGTMRYGNSSGNITLHVQFSTNVTDFFIQGYEKTTDVVVTEHTKLTFECRAQSTPTADIRIIKRNTTVIESSTENILVYNTTASCYSEQVPYNCKGSNLLSTESSTRNVLLTVKCKPRADHAIQFIVASAINQTVTMSYTAAAYPPPSFLWYRNGSSIGTSDTRTSVSSSIVQTNLTVTKVQDSDFGEYMLNIANDVGSIIESFQLIREEPVLKEFPNTSNNIWAIIGGSLAGGMVILCGIVVPICICRRRYVKDKQPEYQRGQSVTYENLKIEQIPHEPLDHQIETSNNEIPETNIDKCNTYEELSQLQQDNDKVSDYTQLGNTNTDDSKQTYENLKTRLAS